MREHRADRLPDKPRCLFGDAAALLERTRDDVLNSDVFPRLRRWILF
jgi:hypothetical protein